MKVTEMKVYGCEICAEAFLDKNECMEHVARCRIYKQGPKKAKSCVKAMIKARTIPAIIKALRSYLSWCRIPSEQIRFSCGKTPYVLQVDYSKIRGGMNRSTLSVALYVLQGAFRSWRRFNGEFLIVFPRTWAICKVIREYEKAVQSTDARIKREFNKLTDASKKKVEQEYAIRNAPYATKIAELDEELRCLKLKRSVVVEDSQRLRGNIESKHNSPAKRTAQWNRLVRKHSTKLKNPWETLWPR